MLEEYSVGVGRRPLTRGLSVGKSTKRGKNLHEVELIRSDDILVGWRETNLSL